jgi:uncharacterized lipoprotein YddW (UPF0748 family)
MLHCADSMTVRLTAVILAIVFLAGSAGSAADGDVRAHWVQRASLQSPESIRRMVATAAINGFNTLFVPARTEGRGFDPLMETIDAARERGLRVHAWLNVNMVASASELPASRDHVIYQHPEWLMVPRALAADLQAIDARSPEYLGRLARWTRANADRVDGLYLSPVHAGAQVLVASVVKTLVTNYAVDGIHLDYVRFPGTDFDYSRAALEAFRAEMRGRRAAVARATLDKTESPDPLVYAEDRANDWRLFRQTRLTSLVTRLRSTVKAERPNVIVSAAVMPDASAADDAFQDWRTWLDNGFVDALCPIGTGPTQRPFAALVADLRALAGSTPVWVRD